MDEESWNNHAKVIVYHSSRRIENVLDSERSRSELTPDHVPLRSNFVIEEDKYEPVKRYVSTNGYDMTIRIGLSRFCKKL